MKTAFLTLLAIFSVLRSAGQTEEGRPVAPEKLQRLQTLFEHVLSGTDIRDLNRNFEVRFDTLAQRFGLRFDPKTPIPKHLLDTLHGRINNILGPTPHASLTGQVYFDRYTDQALATVKEYSTDQVFQSIETFVEPPGGMEKFSQRLHDYLKAEVALGHIRIDSIMNWTTIGFIVERDGSLINIADTPLRASVDAFIAQERKWSPGIMSGRPVAYELKLRLDTSYLQGETEWPKHAAWERRQILSWKRKGRHYMFSSLARPDAPVVSFVYDAILGQYRFPIAHAGSREEYRQLIMDIQENPIKQSSLYGALYRVYFYWSGN